MNRRAGVVAGMAAIAAMAGAGLSWWRQAPPVAGGRGLETGAPGSAPDFWALRFDQPGGGQLAMSALRGRPLLLNFWATWCPPCVKELPMLDAFARDHGPRGWQVVGLAVDKLEPVQAFLGRKPVGFQIGIAGLEGVSLSRSLGNAGGQLPFTVVFDREGAIRTRQIGAVDESQLAAWAGDMS